MAVYDYKRIVKLKGPHGEVEVFSHDSKSDGYGSSISTTNDLMQQAIEIYQQMAKVNNESQ